MTDILVPKCSKIFQCVKCYYFTSRESQYNRHVLSRKHSDTDKILTNTDNLSSKCSKMFNCECGNVYKHRQSLFNHKKKCKPVFQVATENVNVNEKDAFIKYLMNENSEFKSILLEQNKLVLKVCENNNNMTINHSNINSNNKTFNLNVFLNDQCKDAMNITEFVDSLKIQLSDLENVGKLGFVNGISNIIIKNLNALEVHKRPVHCTDSKREVLYVKDENKWEKDNEKKNKLRKVVKQIANKNSKLLPEFKAKYPDCVKSESIKSDQYNKLFIEAFGGTGDNDIEKEDQILKNISKEVTIDKTSMT